MLLFVTRKRYDECQKYIEIIKYLHIPESVGSIQDYGLVG